MSLLIFVHRVGDDDDEEGAVGVPQCVAALVVLTLVPLSWVFSLLDSSFLGLFDRALLRSAELTEAGARSRNEEQGRGAGARSRNEEQERARAHSAVGQRSRSAVTVRLCLAELASTPPRPSPSPSPESQQNPENVPLCRQLAYVSHARPSINPSAVHFGGPSRKLSAPSRCRGARRFASFKRVAAEGPMRCARRILEALNSLELPVRGPHGLTDSLRTGQIELCCLTVYLLRWQLQMLPFL
ncbi:unnamed protein product [Lota lota]